MTLSIQAFTTYFPYLVPTSTPSPGCSPGTYPSIPFATPVASSAARVSHPCLRQTQARHRLPPLTLPHALSEIASWRPPATSPAVFARFRHRAKSHNPLRQAVIHHLSAWHLAPQGHLKKSHHFGLPNKPFRLLSRSPHSVFSHTFPVPAYQSINKFNNHDLDPRPRHQSPLGFLLATPSYPLRW